MKNLCRKNKIQLRIKICEEEVKFLVFLKSKLPIVVKADGLAAGKGVTICRSRRQVLKSTNEIFNGRFKTSKN